MKKYLPFIYSFVLLGIFSFWGCKEAVKTPETVNLAFNFQQDTAYEYSSSTHQTMEQHLMGLSIKIEQQMDIQSSYRLINKDSGLSTIQAVYDRIYIKSVNNNLNLEYDSRDSTKQAAELSGIGEMAGRPFTMIVDDKGVIRSVKGIRPARQENKPAGDAKSGKDPIVKGQLNDSTIRSITQQLLNIYPGRSVRPGDGWGSKYNASIGFMDMALDNHFKLVSVRDGVAHLELLSSISSVPSTNPQMKTLSMNMKGSQTGLLDIEISTGLIISGELKQHISGTMKVGNTEIPVEMESATRITGRKQ